MKKDHLTPATRAWVSSEGGKGRASKLTQAQRKAIAKGAAEARWGARRAKTALELLDEIIPEASGLTAGTRRLN